MKTIISAAIYCSALVTQEPQATSPVRVGQISHYLVQEPSGIVKSRQFENTYWVHGDSDTGERLFAVNSAGEVIMPDWLRSQFHVGPTADPDGKPGWPGIRIGLAQNVDWEDISIDERNRIFLFDLGNNNNARRDLGIYELDEPDPRVTTAATVNRRARVRYEMQTFAADDPWYFDCEAGFSWGGGLYLLTKHREKRTWNRFERGSLATSLPWALDEMDDLVQPLKLNTGRDQAPFYCPSGADCREKTNMLAVLCRDGIHIIPVWRDPLWKGTIFPLPVTGEQRELLEGPGDIPDPRLKFEGICWDDDHTVRIVNEAGELFTLDVSSAVR